MLTALELQQRRRRRTPPSPQQQYQEYVIERIEAYKNSLTREELMRLGDEASAELHSGSESQFLLTEVLMEETVDRRIFKRLRLKSFRRWKEQHSKLRAAQRQPSHWGLDPSSPVTELIPRLESSDSTLVVGINCEPVACLLAAHDVEVTFLANDLGCVERLESRIASESLSSRFTGWVVDFSTGWLPEMPPVQLVVIETAVLGDLDPVTRSQFAARLKAQTSPNGLHVLLPSPGSLVAESFLGLYSGWSREPRESDRRRGLRQPTGLVLACPPCHPDTESASPDVSSGHGDPPDNAIAL